jgi:hypothetical protein
MHDIAGPLRSELAPDLEERALSATCRTAGVLWERSASGKGAPQDGHADEASRDLASPSGRFATTRVKAMVCPQSRRYGSWRNALRLLRPTRRTHAAPGYFDRSSDHQGGACRRPTVTNRSTPVVAPIRVGCRLRLRSGRCTLRCVLVGQFAAFCPQILTIDHERLPHLGLHHVARKFGRNSGGRGAFPRLHDWETENLIEWGETATPCVPGGR